MPPRLLPLSLERKQAAVRLLTELLLDEVAKQLGQALALDPQRHHGGLAARDDQRVEVVEVPGDANLSRLGVQLGEYLGVGLEPALQGEDPYRGAVIHQPRGESSCSVSSLEVSRLSMARPRPVEAAATRAGSA